MERKSMGKFIAALRKANGMTQQEVADLLNVSNKAVSRWERDECAPDISMIPALAETFGVTCDELLKGERILENDGVEKREQRLEKQAKNLINRTLSSFKTLVWIALAVAVAGVILMFGISYGFYRPIIGFTVMLLFEACALTIAILAIVRAKDVKRDNEIFENASAEQIAKFNDVLANFSFWAFYLVICAIIASVPFILVESNYTNSVISPETYFIVFFGGVVCWLAMLYSKCKKPYMAWITEGRFFSKEKTVISVQRNIMNGVQLGCVILAWLAFIISPYFATNSEDVTVAYAIGIALAFVLMGASVVYFIVLTVKKKEERKEFLLLGIRNICLLPSALIVANMHSVGWGGVGGVYTRHDLWSMEYLLFALAYVFIALTIFTFIDIFLKRKKKGK